MRNELSPVHLGDCAILAIQRNLAWTTLLEKSISKIALYMSRAMRGSFTATVTIGSPGSEKIYKKSLQISFGCGSSVSKNCELLHITDLFNTTFVQDDFTFTSKIFLKHSLGIRLLHKRAPKLGRITGTSIIQPSLMCREEIVDDHLYPFSKPPKIESEHSTVASVIEALIRRTDCVKQFLRVCQRGHCSYKPAVEHSALRDV